MKKLFMLLALLVASSLLADNISFWKIQKVKSNDTLNIRALANYKSAKVASIPFNEQCVKNHGCGNNIDLDAMMLMEEDEVKTFLAQAQEDWCYIEYKGNFGWAKKRYLTQSAATCE